MAAFLPSECPSSIWSHFCLQMLTFVIFLKNKQKNVSKPICSLVCIFFIGPTLRSSTKCSASESRWVYWASANPFFHKHLHPSDCMQEPPFQNVQMKSSDLELQLPSLHSSFTPLMWWSRTTCCKSHQIFFCNAPRLCFYLFIYLFIFIGIDGKAAYLRLDEHKGSFSSMWLLMLFDMMMSSFRRKSRFDATWGELFLKSDETWWNAAFPELLPKPSATHPIADRKSVSPWSFSRRKQFEHPSQGRVKTTFSGGGWLETIKAIESEGGTSELARWMVWIALCWMDYGHKKKKEKIPNRFGKLSFNVLNEPGRSDLSDFAFRPGGRALK